MPQQSIGATSDTGFTPRKEFIREEKSAPNTFAILAIASSNFIRLYSFPSSVTTALRRLLESCNILLSFREHIHQSLCEFTLDGRPWANSKSAITEKLLIDILAIIYQCGYNYLSSLDYGRESDDRLAMAFSKPSPSLPGSRAGTPLPTSPVRESSASMSVFDKSRGKRVPFALSFVSATLLRVIAPPLHLTPAILQAVRGSWPRGVVSEKKIGDNSFEFKLKGYKWFQQDTFATDSLRYILALLSSLDTHSFTLLSSITLTNRSRFKDLWVFTAPASNLTDDVMHQDSPASSILDSSLGDPKRRVNSPELLAHTSQNPQHRRIATDPGTLSSSLSFQHPRAATDDDRAIRPPPGSSSEHQRFVNKSPTSLLRKPAPRAQVPVSVIHETDDVVSGAIRANLPSTISSSIENMTGVGASGFSHDVLYTSPPFRGLDTERWPTAPTVPIPVCTSSDQEPITLSNGARTSLRPVSTRAKTPPLLVSNSPSPLSSPPRSVPIERQKDVNTHMFHAPVASPGHVGAPPTSALLGSDAFRDSAFSANTDVDSEVPIQWVGNIIESPDHVPRPKLPANERTSSVGPVLPGGWQPTPAEEKSEQDSSVMAGNTGADKTGGNKTPIHEVSSRITSPELNRPDIELRKSEAALVGMITETSPPPLPNLPEKKETNSQSSPGGQGWVLVNVEGIVGDAASQSPPSQAPKNRPSSDQATTSPQAKAIVVVDAMDANKSKTGQGDTDVTLSVKKRFFGLGRKFSRKASPLQGTDSASREKDSKPRSGFREKLKTIGTPEAPRNEEKRRSID